MFACMMSYKSYPIKLSAAASMGHHIDEAGMKVSIYQIYKGMQAGSHRWWMLVLFINSWFYCLKTNISKMMLEIYITFLNCQHPGGVSEIGWHGSVDDWNLRDCAKSSTSDTKLTSLQTWGGWVRGTFHTFYNIYRTF